jgi:hypothetical protein
MAQKSGTMRAAIEAFDGELDAAARKLVAALPEGGFEHQTREEAIATTAACVRLMKRAEAVLRMSGKILAGDIEARAEGGFPVAESEVRTACGCPHCQTKATTAPADRPFDPRNLH